MSGEKTEYGKEWIRGTNMRGTAVIIVIIGIGEVGRNPNTLHFAVSMRST
jgi:hypothetical protein